MSEREEKFEKMLQATLDEYRITVDKMERLKSENKVKTVTYKQLMATKMTLQNLISRYEIYGLIEKQKSSDFQLICMIMNEGVWPLQVFRA